MNDKQEMSNFDEKLIRFSSKVKAKKTRHQTVPGFYDRSNKWDQKYLSV